MIEGIDEYINVLTDLDINEHQFLILWLVETKNEKAIAKYKLAKGDFNVNDIIDLIDRGYLNDFGLVKDDIRTFNIYDFLVTDEFKARLIVDQDDAFSELASVYPSWFFFDNKKIPAKSYDESLAKEYLKYHKNNKSKHEKVIRITKEYHEKFTKGFAQKTFKDYINGKMWLIYEERLNDQSGDIGFKTY